MPSAQILLYDLASTVDCYILSFSLGGASIKVGGALTIPDEFELNFPGKGLFRCQVKWRKPQELKVSFLAGVFDRTVAAFVMRD